MWKYIKFAAAAVTFAMPVSAAAATLLTFDGPSVPYAPYVEDDFVVTDTGGSVVTAGSMHFDIFGGPDSDMRQIVRSDGAEFDVHKMDVISIYPSVAAGGLIGGPADDMRLEGYDENDKLIANAVASSQFGDLVYTFGSSFSGITKLVITGLNAGNWEGIDRDVHFYVDNMIVSKAGPEDDPIIYTPLPASGFLLAAVLLGAGFAARRRR